MTVERARAILAAHSSCGPVSRLRSGAQLAGPVLSLERVRLAAACDALMPRVQARDVGAMREILHMIAAFFAFTWVERDTMPEGAAAYFNWPTGMAVGQRVTDLRTFTNFLHEFGHGAEGRCTYRDPHYADPTVQSWHRCLACETAAWEQARTFLTFTSEMFENLRRSLGTYRSTTPGPAAALARLDSVRDYVKSYAAPIQQRAEWNHMREWLALQQADTQAELKRTFEQSIAGHRARLERLVNVNR